MSDLEALQPERLADVITWLLDRFEMLLTQLEQQQRRQQQQQQQQQQAGATASAPEKVSCKSLRVSSGGGRSQTYNVLHVMYWALPPSVAASS
jgi:hypothetical protein